MVAEEKVLHLPNHEQHTTHQPIIIDFSYFLWVCMLMQSIGNKFLCPPPWSSLRVVVFWNGWFQVKLEPNWKILGLEKQLLCLTWVPPVPLFILLRISMFSSVMEPFVLIYWTNIPSVWYFRHCNENFAFLSDLRYLVLGFGTGKIFENYSYFYFVRRSQDFLEFLQSYGSCCIKLSEKGT